MCTHPKCTFAHTQDQYRFSSCHFGDSCFNAKTTCRYKHPTETREEYMKRTGKTLPDLPLATSSPMNNVKPPVKTHVKPPVKTHVKPPVKTEKKTQRIKKKPFIPYVWGVHNKPKPKKVTETKVENSFTPLEEEVEFPNLSEKFFFMELECEWIKIYKLVETHSGSGLSVMLPKRVTAVVHPKGYLLDFNKCAEKLGFIINVKASKKEIEEFTASMKPITNSYTISIVPTIMLPFIKKNR